MQVILFNLAWALIDVSIITYIFYKLYQILAQTKAAQVLKGLAFFLLLYFIAKFFNIETFHWLLDQLTGVIVIAIVILFQPELRRVLTKLGQSNWLNDFIKKDPKSLNYILKAVETFQLLQIGALIVFERSTGLKTYIESGTVLNAKITPSLLQTIFTNKTPLHDGAVIIKSDQIIAAGCFLPLSDSNTIRKDFGTRHRAALGIAEETDAVVIVVSEETGRISLTYDAKLLTNFEIESLKKELCELLGYDEEELNEVANEKEIN